MAFQTIPDSLPDTVSFDSFIGLDVVSSVLICLVTLGTVVCLVDFLNFISINFMRVTITVKVN